MSDARHAVPELRPLTGRVTRVARLLVCAVLLTLSAAPPSSPFGRPTAALVAGLVAAPPAAAGAPATVTVLGLGDSVTSGAACDCETFVGRYADLLSRRTGTAAVERNDGVPGLTSAQLLQRLRAGGDLARHVPGGSVVLITIGANDLLPLLDRWKHGGCGQACWTAGLPQVADNIRQIVQQVRALQQRPTADIVVTDYWNVFEDGQVARSHFGGDYLQWSDRVTRSANAVICAAAVEAGATCVDLYPPFKGSGDTDPTPLLAGDGDHPNAGGHQRIAEAIDATVLG